jgi:hypothetical protein
VLRDRVVVDNLVELGTRSDGAVFRTPDVSGYLGELALADPMAMGDVHAMTTDEIVDYLVELGGRLDCASNPRLRLARELSYVSAPTTRPIVDEQYRVMPLVFARPVLEEMLTTGFDRAYLDGWVRTELSGGRTLDVRAFGSRCVHVTAGTSPVLAALAVIRNALTRGDAIIKSPSNDPLTAAAIAETMHEMAPDHPLTRHVSVGYWRGGDERIEAALYQPQNIEKIVAWGGFASLRHVTRYIQPGIELVSFDPKRSASVIGADAFDSDAELNEAAARLAVDIGQLNQAACANARTVFVVCGSDDAGQQRLRDLGERTYAALLKLPERVSTLPKHGIARGLLGAIDAARFDEDWFHVIGGRDGEGAIVVSRLPEPVDFAAALNDRVANLVPVDSVEEAASHFDAYTQTLGVYPEALKATLRELAGLRGAQRIVSLGYSCVPTFAGPQDALEPLRRLCRWVTDERLSPQRHPLGDLFVDTENAPSIR